MHNLYIVNNSKIEVRSQNFEHNPRQVEMKWHNVDQNLRHKQATNCIFAKCAFSNRHKPAQNSTKLTIFQIEVRSHNFEQSHTMQAVLGCRRRGQVVIE